MMKKKQRCENSLNFSLKRISLGYGKENHRGYLEKYSFEQTGYQVSLRTKLLPFSKVWF